MKNIFTLIILLFLSSSTQAQHDTTKLSGTWKLSQFTYGNNLTVTPQQNKLKKFKLFTPTHFTVIELKDDSQITSTSLFGTYEFKGDYYTEKVLHVNQESAGMIGGEFSFTLRYDGGNKLIQTGSFNGIKSHEIWTRVADKSDTSGDPIFNAATLQAPLYLIEHAGEKTEFIPNGGYKSPLSILPQECIEAVEVIKDMPEIQKQYGDKASKGIIIITLKAGYWAAIEKDLKKKGNIK